MNVSRLTFSNASFLTFPLDPVIWSRKRTLRLPEGRREGSGTSVSNPKPADNAFLDGRSSFFAATSPGDGLRQRDITGALSARLMGRPERLVRQERLMRRRDVAVLPPSLNPRYAMLTSGQDVALRIDEIAILLGAVGALILGIKHCVMNRKGGNTRGSGDSPIKPPSAMTPHS